MEQPKIYTVQPGDSLSLISKKLFGDFSMTGQLANMNKISNPNLILPGQQLIVPDVKTTYQEAEVVSSEDPSKTKEVIGKVFAWGIVAVAAVLLGREAMKQKKKNKKVSAT